MRFDLVYSTTFDYPSEVVESQNELRAAPMQGGGQQLLHYDVRTTPSSRVFSYVDYWGTRVDTFGIRGPHRSLTVTAEASVDTAPPPVLAASPRWSELEQPSFRDAHREYLAPSPHAAWGDTVEAAARKHAAQSGDDVVGAVLALHRMIGTTCEYEPGSTYVGVPVEEVLASRHGVCQDFAHLLVALCRSLAIPARYVSGYLFARDGEVGRDPEADRIEVQTHAWAEVAVPGFGWWGLDPTNRQQVGERYVKIGHGRDYDDVAPLRGVYTGPAEHDLEVAVEMRRAASPPAPPVDVRTSPGAARQTQQPQQAQRARQSQQVQQQ